MESIFDNWPYKVKLIGVGTVLDEEIFKKCFYLKTHNIIYEISLDIDFEYQTKEVEKIPEITCNNILTCNTELKLDMNGTDYFNSDILILKKATINTFSSDELIEFSKEIHFDLVEDEE